MKKSNLIMLSAGVLALSAAAFAAVPVIEKAKSLDNSEIRHFEGEVRHAPQRVMTLPYIIVPTTEQWNECVTFNLNEDSETWDTVEKDGGLCLHYKYHSNNAADDWVIMPSVNLTAGPYKITCEYQTQNSYMEQFRFAIGTQSGETIAPTDMTRTIMDCPGVSSDGAFTEVSNEFIVETEGLYYVGLYCYSPENYYNLWIRNITIEKLDATVPMAPTIESIEFTGTEGTISVKAPENKANGESLGSTPLTLDVAIDDVAIEGSPFSATPGEVKDLNLTLPNGRHTLTATASYEIEGETKTSMAASQDFRVSKIIDIPMALPVTLTPDEDEFDASTVINANEDTFTWKYVDRDSDSELPNSTSINSAFRYMRSSTMAADDWLILPAMQRGDATSFQISYKFGTKYDIENYEIYVASQPTVEAMLAGKLVVEEDQISTYSSWTDKNAIFSFTESDTFYIGIHASSAAYKGNIYIADFKVDLFDGSMPKKPIFSEFTFDGGDGEVAIELPTLCFDESVLTASELTVNLSVDGEEVGTQTGAPGATVTIPVTGLALGDHNFTATASFVKDGVTLTSEQATAVHKIVKPSSFTYPIPVDLNFKDPTVTEDIVITNVNGDEKTWTIGTSGLVYNYNTAEPANDWAIIAVPVVIEDATKTYQITVTAKSSARWAEAFAVYYGSSPTVEQMTNQVLDQPDFAVGSDTECTNTFTVPAPGRYYFGIHCYSNEDMLALYISNMKIDIAPSANGPAIVEELTATPDPTGLPKATVEFNMPTLNRLDEEMAADTQLTATVKSTVDTKTVTGTPGQTVSTEINTVDGQNTITVQVENADGLSEETTVDVRCGLDTPKAPVITSTEFSEDGLGVTLTWDPVTEGVNNGIIYNLKYRIMTWDSVNGWTQVGETSDTSYEFRVAEGSAQAFHDLGVKAFTSETTQSLVTEREVMAGQPYALDVTEEFANNEKTYNPIYYLTPDDSATTPYWTFDYATNYCADAAITDQKMIIGRTTFGTGEGAVMLPLVATTGVDEVEFTVDVYYDSAITPAITVLAQTYGTERMLVGELAAQAEPGWATYTFTLPAEMGNRPWVQMCIYNVFGNSSQVSLIKGYKLAAKIPDGVTDLLAGKVSVLASRGNIAINGAEGKNITVSDLAGKVVYSATGESNGIVIPAAAGVHIVRIDNKTYKVMVK